MKYKIIIYLSLLLCVGMVHVINAGQTGENTTGNDRQKAALLSLELLKQLPLTIQKKLGFESDLVVKKSKLGNPLNVYIIGLDSLQEFKPGDDPNKIPEDVKEIIYPVYVDENLKSSITIREIKGEWKFVSIGGAEIRYADHARKIHSACSPKPLPSYFMVQVPAMYLTFLAYYLDGILYLIPTHQDPDLEFPLYEPVLAEEVFLELKRLVEKYEKLLVLPYPSPLLLVGKEELHPGESTWLKITIKGLIRYKKLGLELPFRLQNKTPGIVNMEGGNIQKHIIRPEDIDPDGIYTMTRILTGKVPGKFNIIIEFE